MNEDLWQMMMGRVSQIGACADDDDETRLQKVILVVTAALMSTAGVLWGIFYWFAGEPWAAALPIGYSLLSAINLYVFNRTLRFDIFRFFQILLTLFLPFLLMLVLGGYITGSATIIWSFIAPLVALLCWNTRATIIWFTIYLVAVVLAGLATPWLRDGNNLAQWMIVTFFVLNIWAVSHIAFLVLLRFVHQKELAMELMKKNRELESANLEQERLLRQSERLATLGKLSAGIAHELNNPAAAAQRGAAQLRKAIPQLEQAQFQLGAQGCGTDQQEILARFDSEARGHAERPLSLDPIARSDREVEIEDSLEDAGVEEGWEFAPILVSMGYDSNDVAQLAESFSPVQFATVISTLTSTYATHNLLAEIGQGAGRITEIVRALKAYTYMDQAPVQFLDIHEGLENTLVVLNSKLKQGVEVRRDYADDLPPIQGYGGELNQVWTNLIDNAIDAMDGEGTLWLRTRHAGEWVVVEVTDSGSGIPDEVAPYIFDPFYTTKSLGQGTGLGLNTSRNIVVDKHHGDIAAQSSPGRTAFTVKLPLNPLELDPEGE